MKLNGTPKQTKLELVVDRTGLLLKSLETYAETGPEEMESGMLKSIYSLSEVIDKMSEQIEMVEAALAATPNLEGYEDPHGNSLVFADELNDNMRHIEWWT